MTDREGNPIIYQTTEDQIMAQIDMTKNRQSALRQQLTKSQQALASAKSGEHPEIAALMMEEQMLTENLKALQEGRAEERLAELMKIAGQEAERTGPIRIPVTFESSTAPVVDETAAIKTPDLSELAAPVAPVEAVPEQPPALVNRSDIEKKQADLEAVGESFQNEGEILAAHQEKKKAGWLTHMREKLEKTPGLRRTVAFTAAFFTLLGMSYTVAGRASLEPENQEKYNIEPVATTRAAEPVRVASSVGNHEFTVQEKPTAPQESRVGDLDMSEWIKIAEAGHYSEANVRELFNNPTAKADFLRILHDHLQDKKVNPAQTFATGESDPHRAALLESLENWLSRLGNWRATQ